MVELLGHWRSIWLGRTSVSILCAGFADAAFGVQGAPRKALFSKQMIVAADFPIRKIFIGK
jgi:hypothetical protein